MIRESQAVTKAPFALLSKVGTSAKYAIYTAILEQEKGKEDPKLESVLNHSYIKNLDHLRDMIRNLEEADFIVNARICKFLLSQKDLEALERFFSKQKLTILKCLHDNMVGDGYSEMVGYQQQFILLEKYLPES